MEKYNEIFNDIYSIKDKITQNEYLLLNNNAYKLLKIIDKQQKEKNRYFNNNGDDNEYDNEHDNEYDNEDIEIFDNISSIKHKITQTEYISLNNNSYELIKIIIKQKEENNILKTQIYNNCSSDEDNNLIANSQNYQNIRNFLSRINREAELYRQNELYRQSQNSHIQCLEINEPITWDTYSQNSNIPCLEINEPINWDT